MPILNITQLINHRINRLQRDVNELGPGGGLEKLRQQLTMLRAAILNFIHLIDQVEDD